MGGRHQTKADSVVSSRADGRQSFSGDYLARNDLSVNLTAKAILQAFQLITHLEVHPEFGTGPEISPQAAGGVRGDGALAVGDLVDAVGRHLESLCQLARVHAQGFQELFSQYLARMNGWQFFSHGPILCRPHGPALMIVGYLHVMGAILFPMEANAPLPVDADAVLAFAIPAQSFQAIPRNGSKYLQADCGIKHDQLPPGSFLQLRVHGPHSIAIEDTLCGRVLEAANQARLPLVLFEKHISCDVTRQTNDCVQPPLQEAA